MVSAEATEATAAASGAASVPTAGLPGGAGAAAGRPGTARPPVGTSDPTRRMSFTRTTLPSGVRVVTERLEAQRSVALGAWVAVGSRNEPDRLAGATHFLEHLLFKGTPTRSALRIAQDFDAIGGDINAFTTQEYTCFHARVAAADGPLAVETIADMLQHSLLSPQDVESERNVVLEEIASHEDSPDDVVYDQFHRSLWPGHPLGRPVEGLADAVRAMTRDDIAGFLSAYYVPRAIVVSAAGDVEHDAFVELVHQAFDDLTERPLPDVVPPPRANGALSVTERALEQAYVVYGTEGITRGDDRRWALWVLNTALGGGMSSRLFQTIREQRGLAYNVSSGHHGYRDTGAFNVFAGCRPDRVAEVLRIARDEVDGVVADGISDEEYARALGHVRGVLVLSFDEPGAVMSHLGRSELLFDRIMTVDEMVARVEAVTMEDVRAVAREVLTGPWTLAVLGARMEASFERFAGEAA